MINSTTTSSIVLYRYSEPSDFPTETNTRRDLKRLKSCDAEDNVAIGYSTTLHGDDEEPREAAAAAPGLLRRPLRLLRQHAPTAWRRCVVFLRRQKARGGRRQARQAQPMEVCLMISRWCCCRERCVWQWPSFILTLPPPLPANAASPKGRRPRRRRRPARTCSGGCVLPLQRVAKQRAVQEGVGGRA
jgi:hypothetical protein